MHFAFSNNYIDIILAIPLLWAAYKGFTKGLIIEVASLAALILGIYGCLHFSYYTEDFLKNYLGFNSGYLHLISFAVTFIAIILIIFIIAKLIEKLVDIVSLSLINKLLGSVFCILKFALILSLILYLINSFDTDKKLIKKSARNESYLYKPVSSLITTFVPAIKNFKCIKDSLTLKKLSPVNFKP